MRATLDIGMPKRRKKNRTSAIWSPVSPVAPLETQRVGQVTAGLFSAFDLFWSGITGKYKEAWYDRALHVIGGLLILGAFVRSEEHTSELQSQSNLVCRLLLEKKKNKCIVHVRYIAQTEILEGTM